MKKRLELEESLSKLEEAKATHYRKIACFQKEVATTDSTPKKFELDNEIEVSEKKIKEIDIKITDINQQIKDIDARQTTPKINEDKLQDRRDVQNGKPYLWKDEQFAEVDTNIIWVKYNSRNIFNFTNLFLGYIDLQIKINDELCKKERVDINRHRFSCPFTCKDSGKIRIANITVHIKLLEVNYFLKVDGKEYKFQRYSYKE